MYSVDICQQAAENSAVRLFHKIESSMQLHTMQSLVKLKNTKEQQGKGSRSDRRSLSLKEPFQLVRPRKRPLPSAGSGNKQPKQGGRRAA